MITCTEGNKLLLLLLLLFPAIFAMEKFQKKISTLSLKLNYSSPRHQTAVFKVLISFKCS